MRSICPATAADESFLREMLYLALFVPPGKPAFPREVLDAPKIAHHVDGFGSREGDVGFIAQDTNGDAIGAVWVRQFTADDPGYGYVDDEAPELSIAIIAQHRGEGLGTDLLRCLLNVVPRCSLSVDDRNGAIDLYRRNGFATVATDGHSITMLRK